MSSTQVEKLAGRLKLYPNPAQALVHFADEDQIVWDRIEGRGRGRRCRLPP